MISTDTLVEQPLVAAWVDTSLDEMRTAAREQELPITPHKLTPEVEDSFWVNLIGKGYPAPRQKFRWCTERLKIKPSNKFIRGVVQQYGEAILVLGTRKAESQRRAATMEKHEARRVRERLRPNASLPNSLVYTPIEDWTNDDVWLYLMQVKNPWGHDNKSLLGMYQGATEGGECPLVVDTSTPSCGTSRFGCWVCTVVDKDRSMEAMIKNDEEKVWMTPLLELRNELDKPDDRDRRDFRRMNGQVQLFHDRTVPGPYTKDGPRALAAAGARGAAECSREGPAEFRDTRADHAGRARTRSAASGCTRSTSSTTACRGFTRRSPARRSPGATTTTTRCGRTTGTLLKEVCGDDEEFFDLQVRLLGIEQKPSRHVRARAGIFEELEKSLPRGILPQRARGRGRSDRARPAYAEAKDQAKGEMVPHSRVVEKQLGLLRDDLERLGE